jgi:chromate transporter
VGSKQAGALGGIVATLGIVFPSLVIITVIAAFLRNFAHIPAVIHAFGGIRACVCVLILNAVLKLKKSSVIDLPTTVIFAATFLLSTLFNLSPAWIVVAAGVLGFLLKKGKGGEKA